MNRAAVGSPPQVSVVMSVHNGARYLRAAIESILGQTLRDLELIVVDDASTDGSGELCRTFADRDARVVHLTNVVRAGLTHSLNLGLAQARGQFVARMDADDISLPYRLERQVEYLRSHADVGIVGSFYTEIDEHGHVLVETYRFPCEPIIVAWRMAFENPLPHPPIMVRRDLVDAVGRYDERWRTSQDFDLFTRLSAVTKLANIPEVLFVWRRHSASVSGTLNREQRDNALRISHGYISRILGRDVGKDVAELLWTREPKSLRDVSQLVSVSLELARRLEADARWTPEERQMLRGYAARKLLSQIAPYMKHPRSWPVLFKVACFSPAVLAAAVMKKHRVVGAADSAACAVPTAAEK